MSYTREWDDCSTRFALNPAKKHKQRTPCFPWSRVVLWKPFYQFSQTVTKYRRLWSSPFVSCITTVVRKGSSKLQLYSIDNSVAKKIRENWSSFNERSLELYHWLFAILFDTESFVSLPAGDLHPLFMVINITWLFHVLIRIRKGLLVSQLPYRHTILWYFILERLLVIC